MRNSAIWSSMIQPSATKLSQEDRRAIDIMNRTITLKDGHYEMVLPWRNHPPDLSDNKSLTEHRLKLLKRRLTKDPALHEKYSGVINDLRKGYARKVPTVTLERPDAQAWYLPQHLVFHPQSQTKSCSAALQNTKEHPSTTASYRGRT